MMGGASGGAGASSSGVSGGDLWSTILSLIGGTERVTQGFSGPAQQNAASQQPQQGFAGLMGQPAAQQPVGNFDLMGLLGM